MSKTYRVLYVHHRGKMGGAERSLLTLFSGLDEDLCEVYVACPPEGRFSSAVKNANCRHFPVEFSPLGRIDLLVKNTKALIGLVKTHRIHLIHSNAPQTNIPSGIASKITKVPVVWHARNLLGKGMWDLDRRFSVLADHIICNSRAIGRRFEGSGRIEKKVSVIVNAVDTEHLAARNMSKTEARRRTGLPSQGFIVGLFDRLDPRKNHDTVVRAVAEMRRSCSNTLLLVVGEALERHAEKSNELMRLAEDLGVDGSVRLMGYRHDVFDWMSACDVIVQAAENEGCSRVLCEAQAVGRPVIAADDGGNPELLEHEVTGLLFKLNNVEELARHLCRLCSSPETAARMGKAGMRKAAEDFSIDRYVEQTVRIYQSLVP